MGGVVLRNDTLFVVDGNYDFTLYNWQGEYLGKWFQPKIRHTMNFFPRSQYGPILRACK